VGQQQLLLIVLGVLLVGLAIYVGISMFGSNAENSSRSAVIHDLQIYGASAQTYYTKLQAIGGGKESYVGMSPGSIGLKDNENGHYYIESVSKDACNLIGVGRIVASNDDSVRVRYVVTPQRNRVEIIN
jgi:hypothetical protein